MNCRSCFSVLKPDVFSKKKYKKHTSTYANQPSPAIPLIDFSQEQRMANETSSFKKQDARHSNQEPPGSSTIKPDNSEQSTRSTAISQEPKIVPPIAFPKEASPTINPTNDASHNRNTTKKPKRVTSSDLMASPRISISESPVASTFNINREAVPKSAPQSHDDKPRRSFTLSPQFSEAVKVEVETTLDHDTLHQTKRLRLDLLRGVSLLDNYSLIQNTKQFAETFCNTDQELRLVEGSCTISCNCNPECELSETQRPLENWEQWKEVEVLTSSYETKGHNGLGITITRRLGITKKQEPSITPKNAISWIRKELTRSMKLTQTGGTKEYLPKDKLINLTPRNIFEALVQDENAIFSVPMNDHTKRTKLALRIYRDAPLLMLICLYELHGEEPFELLEAFLGHYEKEKVPLPLPLECPDWLSEHLEYSYQKCYARQWAFQAAVFKVVGENQRFADDIIIPYISKEKFDSGSFSIVYKVQFDPSHQNLYRLGQESNPQLALKAVQRHSKGINRDKTNEAFKNEQLILKGLQNLDNDHIIKLLATYYQGDHCHFLFPLADCNLERYMRTNPNGFASPEVKEHKEFLAWIWSQMEGIASGIHAFHENTHENTNENRRQSISKVFLDPNVAREVRPVVTGYHHDIKPSNILYFKQDQISIKKRVPHQGLLQIADFGIGKFHSEHSGNTSKGEDRFRGTITYSAPESKIPPKDIPDEEEEQQDGESKGSTLKLSRPYDVWSFGCVLMEVLVWVVYGGEGRTKFGNDRVGQADAGDPTSENDAFFYLGPRREPRVRDSVKSWMWDLGQHPRIAKHPQGSLDGILKLVQEVLVVNPKQRPKASIVAQRLKGIAAIAEEEAAGLDTITEVPSNTSPVPSIIATDTEETTPRRRATMRSAAIVQSATRSESPKKWDKDQRRSDTMTTVKSDDSRTSTTAQPSISRPSDRNSLYIP